MKVILTDEIRGLGTRGEVVTVKDGYARNFLLPKKLARQATSGNLKASEQERRKWALLGQQEKDAAQKAANSVQGLRIVVNKRVGESGQLFGSVTANDIAEALIARGVEVDKRRIELTQPIKATGVHDVEVRLHREVTAHVQVEVLPLGVASSRGAASAETEAPAAPEEAPEPTEDEE